MISYEYAIPNSYEDSLIIARISDDLYRVYSSSPTFILFPPYAGKRTYIVNTDPRNIKITLSPGLTSIGIRLPSLSNPPAPAARTVPSDNFSTAFSGINIPLDVFYNYLQFPRGRGTVSALIRETRTLSRSGRIALMF